MQWNSLTIKEKGYFLIWHFCKIMTKPFYLLGNWSADKLNKSYYKNL